MADSEPVPSVDQIEEYVEAANACIREGIKDPSCDKAKALEAGAIAAGADAQMVRTVSNCVQEYDSEECAKAAAKLGAVSACTAMTEGAGATLCARFAPKVVDLIWPVVGPAVGPVWDWAIGLGEAAFDLVAGFGTAILDSLGIDLGTNADPTVTDVYWKIKGAIDSQLQSAYEQSLQSLKVARDAAAEELELPATSVFATSDGRTLNADIAMEAELEYWLKREPDWSDEFDVEQTRTMFGVEGRRYVRFGARPDNLSESFSAEWRPSNFAYFVDGWAWGNDRKGLAEAAAGGLAIRAQGLRRGTMRAIGSVIQRQTMLAEKQRLEQIESEQSQSSSSNTLLFVLAAAALAGGGIWLWNKRAK